MKPLTEDKLKHIAKVESEFERQVLILLFSFGPIMDNIQKAKVTRQISELVKNRI